VRIGGIFALERVARDSARDHPTVMEVLAAFLREHSREPYVQPAGPTQPAGTSSRGTSPDVQAALTVIGRRDASRDQQRIDLSAAVIPAALLFDTDLTGVRLVGADLSSAILNRATLAGAKLADADFSHAALAEASLTGALLDGARFEGADLTGARFDTAPPGWDRDPQTGRLRRTVNRLPGSARDTMPSHPAIDRICR
jgi:hypothetical protein